VAETVFDTINHEYDKVEQKKKQKNRAKFGNEEKESDCILHGYVKKLVSDKSDCVVPLYRYRYSMVMSKN
jgi:hypothetical protein